MERATSAVDFVRSTSFDFGLRCINLDPELMAADSLLARELVQALVTNHAAWTSCLALWDLKEFGLRELVVDCVFVLTNEDQEEAYGISMPGLMRTTAEQALPLICTMLNQALNPSYVGDLIRSQGPQFVMLSPFVCFSDPRNELQAPVLAQVAHDKAKKRISAMVIAHPQLVPGESVIKYFPDSCRFFISGDFMGVLCASKQRVVLQFFLLDKRPNLESLDLNLTFLEPTTSLATFATLVSDKTHEIYFSENAES
jgi:hypothetical protein